MSNDKSQNLPKTERTLEKWYEAKVGNDHQGLIVDEATGETIAVTYKKENAAFIVKACNHFEEMLKALQHASMSEHHPACKAHGERSGFPERYCTCHVQKAKAVLAKIEGA